MIWVSCSWHGSNHQPLISRFLPFWPQSFTAWRESGPQSSRAAQRVKLIDAVCWVGFQMEWRLDSAQWINTDGQNRYDAMEMAPHHQKWMVRR